VDGSKVIVDVIADTIPVKPRRHGSISMTAPINL
jgi:hypothetical protein